jgi:hypothetical protein
MRLSLAHIWSWVLPEQSLAVSGDTDQQYITNVSSDGLMLPMMEPLDQCMAQMSNDSHAYGAA